MVAVKLARLTHKIVTQLHLVAELYHLQFLLQVASPETFGYTLIHALHIIVFLFVCIRTSLYLPLEAFTVTIF